MNLAETARIRARLKYEYAPHADVTEIANASKDILALLEAVERLTVASDDAFRRGVEAMRDGAIMVIKHLSHEDGIGMGSARIEGAIACVRLTDTP